MTNSARVSRLTKIITLSSISVACLGITSCGPLSQSEKEFAAQNGYQRSDYFGTGQNRNFVPKNVEKPDYFPSYPKTKLGRPGY